MRTGAASIVEVRLSRKDTEALTAGLKGEVHKHDIQTTPAMTVTLQAPEGGFIIQRRSRETQWIDGSSHAKLGLLSQADFRCSKWIVTPLGSGMRRLDIVAAAKTSEGGVQAETPMPEQIVHVQVRVNYLASIQGTGPVGGGRGGGRISRRVCDNAFQARRPLECVRKSVNRSFR